MADIHWSVLVLGGILATECLFSNIRNKIFRERLNLLEKTVAILVDRTQSIPWVSVAVRHPTEHGFIEVLAPDGNMHNGLMPKIVMFNGNIGGIKFWRPLKEAGK